MNQDETENCLIIATEALDMDRLLNHAMRDGVP